MVLVPIGPSRAVCGGLHIDGTKRQSRVRDVPLWVSWLPLVPVRSRSRFVTLWRANLGAELGIYDLRRSFAVWMDDAGIPRSRQRLYMGHAVGDMTGLYQTRELLSWLPEDALRLKQFAGHLVPPGFPGIPSDTHLSGVARETVAA
jgi:integrase